VHTKQAVRQSRSVPPPSMATFQSFATQFAEARAYQLNIFESPSVWGLAALIPLSLRICSSPDTGLGPVLCVRLLVIVCMNFVQKESVMAFPPWFLLGYQMALQVVLISGYNFRQLSFGKWGDLVQWLVWMTPFWVAQLITSIYALQHTSVSTVQVIRSLLPLMSFALEKATQGKPKHVTGPLVGSMLLVIVGTAMYSCTSVSAVTPTAFFWIFTNCVFTVVATVLRSWFLKDKDFTLSLPFAQVSVSTVAIPFICIAAVLSGEMHQWPSVLKDTPPTAWFWATMSGLVAGCFSFLQFRCQGIISGTSDLMFQNAVKVLIITMGIVMFGDTFDMESFTACCVTLGGCALYGYLRQSEGKEGAKVPASSSQAPLIDVEERNGQK